MTSINGPKRDSSPLSSRRVSNPQVNTPQGNTQAGGTSGAQQTGHAQQTSSTSAASASQEAHEADQYQGREGTPPGNNVRLQGTSAQRAPPLASMSLGSSSRATVKGQQVTPENAQQVLEQVRSEPHPAYGDLTKVLANSGGKLSTTEVFADPAKGPDGKPLNYEQTERFLRDPTHWHPERAKIQQELSTQRLDSAQQLSDAMAASGNANTLVAVMGNTAAGKSTALRTTDDFAHLAGHLEGAINPDPIKADLVQLARKSNGQNTISHRQAHFEGAVVAQRVEQEMLGRENSSLLYDKRFSWSGEFEGLLKTAETNNKTVQAVDIDSNLTRSAVRVLMRPVGGADPRVPFNAVAEGFVGTRTNREEVLHGRPDGLAADGVTQVPGFKGVIDNPRITSYDLFVPDQRGTAVRVAYKRDGVWHGPQTPEHQRMFDSAVKSNPYGDVEEARHTMIDTAFIQRQVDEVPERFKAPMREALGRYQGMTLEKALDEHAKRLN